MLEDTKTLFAKKICMRNIFLGTDYKGTASPTGSLNGAQMLYVDRKTVDGLSSDYSELKGLKPRDFAT
jgi:hypothetical protein